MAARTFGGKHVSGAPDEKEEKRFAFVGMPNAVRRKIAVEQAQCIIIHNYLTRVFREDARL
jgi:hypothetical protein